MEANAFDEEDCDKLAMTSHHELIRFMCKPFRPHGALETFRCVMDLITATVKWIFAFVYLNDITIFFNSPSEHVEDVLQILHLLSGARFRLKFKKRWSLTDGIDYSSQIICPISWK